MILQTTVPAFSFRWDKQAFPEHAWTISQPTKSMQLDDDVEVCVAKIQDPGRRCSLMVDGCECERQHLLAV